MEKWSFSPCVFEIQKHLDKKVTLNQKVSSPIFKTAIYVYMSTRDAIVNSKYLYIAQIIKID